MYWLSAERTACLAVVTCGLDTLLCCYYCTTLTCYAAAQQPELLTASCSSTLLHKTPAAVDRYQLMHEVNALGFYTTAQLVLPHMLQQQQGRIIAVSPPIYSRFFKGKTAYAMTKVAMSVLVMGLANELTDTGVTVTALWPATGVQSAVTDYIATDPKLLRKPEIFADACLAILQSDAGAVNGKCLIDEDCLRQLKGQSNFSAYQVKYHSHIMIDMVMCCVLHSIESCSTGGMSRFAFGQLTYPVRNVHVMYNWAAICKSQH